MIAKLFLRCGKKLNASENFFRSISPRNRPASILLWPWPTPIAGIFSHLSYLGIYNSPRMGLMEDDVKDFLKRIVWTVSLGFLWLTVTLGIGAYNQLMVPDPTLTIGNIIFYIWSASTLAALIYINYRIWKKKFPHG